MRGEGLSREQLGAAALEGRLLAHDVRDADGRIVLRKGRPLRDDDRQALADAPWTALHLLVLDPDDLHEDQAGVRLAEAAAGDGTRAEAASAGHWPILSTRRGILDVRHEAMLGVNSTEGMSAYSLYAGQVVDRGEIVARAKIIPFAIPLRHLEHAERVASAAQGLVAVRPFLPLRVAAVVQESPGTRGLARFRQALAEKVEWFGATLLAPAYVRPDSDEITAAFRQALESAAGLVVVAGSRAMDPLDPVFEALQRVGAEMVRHGVPAHPGSLFWLARLRGVAVVGMPSCGLFSQATVFDLVLPRLLAGETIGAPELAALGHGGFLTRDMAYRFPPYRAARERGAVE